MKPIFFAIVFLATSCSMYVYDNNVTEFADKCVSRDAVLSINLTRNGQGSDRILVQQLQNELKNRIKESLSKKGINTLFLESGNAANAIDVNVNYTSDKTLTNIKSIISGLSLGIIPMRFNSTIDYVLKANGKNYKKEYSFHQWNHLLILPIAPFVKGEADVENEIFKDISNDIASLYCASRIKLLRQ